MQPSNSNRSITHRAQTCIQIIADDDHQASTRAVCVLRLIFTADSRTEILCVLLPVSITHHIVVSCREVECLLSANGSVALGPSCIVCMYPILLLLISAMSALGACVLHTVRNT